MHINAALKVIRDRFPILKHAAIKAATDEQALLDLVTTILDQYYETPGNKERLTNLFGEDVMICLIAKSKEINSWAEIKLMELQAKDGSFNMN